MSWREGIEAGLPPPPLDGESGDLRRDIIDELADHLDCAMQRERKHTDDDVAAQRAVIERFGNPGRIAYRLWFDAMKETIMSQRISLVTNIVVAMACIAIALVAFNSLKQNTALTDALLAKLESIGAGTEAKASAPVWADATIPILVDDKPAVDYLVTLLGEAFNPGKDEFLRHRTDADGRVAFGPIRPGRYSLRVEDPSGLQLTTDTILYPGHNELDPVSLPAPKPQPATVSFAVNLPEQIKNRIAFVRLKFAKHLPEHGAHNNQWHWPSLDVLLRPDGTVAQIQSVPVGGGRLPPQPTGNEEHIDLEALEQRRTVELDGALTYRLADIVLYVPIQDVADRFVKITLPLVRPRRARQFSPQYIKPIYFGGLPPLRATSTKENAWQVEIPDWLVETVEKHFEDSGITRG